MILSLKCLLSNMRICTEGRKQSGLKQAMKVLEGIDDIAICKLSAKDVVRHALVQKIIRAYDSFAGKK